MNQVAKPGAAASTWKWLYKVGGMSTLLNLFDLVNYALVGMIILALFVGLRQASASFMTIAAVLGFIGITTFF